MSRATISTGNIIIKRNDEVKKEDQNDPMHIAIIGDFGGLSGRETPLADRKFRRIDRDLFDEVFARTNVELSVPINDLTIKFEDIDDLHPDFLYARVELFDELKKLRRKLKKNDSFAEAAEEIFAWADFQGRETQAEAPVKPIDSQGMLDTLLSQSELSKKYETSPEGQIDKLIKDIVAPYVNAKEDPRLPELENAVDKATSELLRKLMHSSEFKTLEASWRSLYWLVRRIETGPQLKLFLLDASKEELINDTANGGLGLHKLLVENNRVAGGHHFSVVLADYMINDSLVDISLTKSFASAGNACNAGVFIGGGMSLAGCDSLENPDPDDWGRELTNEVRDAWVNVRHSQEASHVALFAPRFMVRLPYGKKTSPIECFGFEELPQGGSHQFYLWGNSAYLGAQLIAQSYTEYGWQFEPGRVQQIDEMLLHAYSEDGEDLIKPCTEAYLVDRAAKKMMESGLLPVLSVKNTNTVLIPKFMSISEDANVHGRWITANGEL